MAYLVAQFGAILASCLIWYQWRRNSNQKLPPGPPPLPIVGNILDLPPRGPPEWQHWLKHPPLYGPISSITIMSQTIVLLNDTKVAAELMDKRGANNSSRPWMEFGWEMVGFGKFTTGLPYGEEHRLHRKLLVQYIGTKAAVERTLQIQEREVGRTLQRILDKPRDLTKHLNIQAGTLIIELTYGYTIDQAETDPVYRLAVRVVDQFNKSILPGAWLVDSVPALKHLPSWFPGGGFKKTADLWRRQVLEAVDIPFEFAKKRMADGVKSVSYVANILANDNAEEASKYSAAALFGAGSDTTAATLSLLYLALIKNPHIISKAQSEIDRVTGGGRLPQFSDRESLPYIEAIIQESHRWQPVAPNGIPHTSDKDQVYEGYFIPKHSVLMANVRWFTRDPAVYHSPDDFIPERYSEPFNEPDPREFIFGFGRRICPGRALVDSVLFLNIAQSLAVFDFNKATGENGDVIEPVLDIAPGTVSHPKDYALHVAPRSEKHAKLIRDNAASIKQSSNDKEVLEQYGLTPDDD